jgi:hypothetical protein
MPKMAELMPEKFYGIDTCGLYYKSFKNVIYDRNDSMIVEPLL